MFQLVIHSFVPLMYLFTLLVVILTAESTTYSHLLQTMTQENGVFESLSVLWLFSIFIYGSLFLYKNKTIFKKPFILIVFTVSILALLAALEEISWGQHLFHFESSEYFLQSNLQKETNIHNFMNANIFSSIMYASIYILFVFIPLFYKILSKPIKYLRYFDINLHYILIILFASTLQVYFYNDFGVYADMSAHILALAFFAYVMLKSKSTGLLKIHYFTVVMTTIIFMCQYQIFNFLNMQYEIREMFVTLAALLIFIAFIQKEKEIT